LTQQPPLPLPPPTPPAIIHYLINPDGEFVTFFGKNTDADQLARQMLQHAEEWQKAHPDYHKGSRLVPPAKAAAAPAPAK
jgi:protein SCO1/2